MRAPFLPRDPAGLARLLAPLLVLVVALKGGIGGATARSSWGSLGRDQGIFQYIAWAIGQGDVAYRDVRDVNGPVVPLIHLLFQALGGTEEHRFRCLDLLVSSLVFFGAGALVSGKRDAGAVLWGAAAWAALMAQYVVYGFWDTAQRESFLDWFVLASIALQLRGRAPVLVGALAVVPCLGKPTYALFLLPQIVVVLAGKDRARSLRDFALGGALGALVPLAFLFLRGDPSAFLRIEAVDVPTMYRFIWPRPAEAILGMGGYATATAAAVATSAGLAALLALRVLPLRALPVACMPLLGLVSVVVQAKGFPYHFHPVTLGTTFGWIVALAALGRGTGRWSLAVATAGGLAVGVHAARLAQAAPDPGEQGYAPARLAAFDRVDFFPNGLRDAASYVAARTGPDDRVQTYGMDAYVLFLARRRSATPYIYAYDLNADAALAGSYDAGGIHPTADQQHAIEELRRAHVEDLGARLARTPPPAFVFVDRSPLMSGTDAVEDFRAHCPEVAAWTREHYRPAAEFEGVRVWLRNDVADRTRKLE